MLTYKKLTVAALLLAAAFLMGGCKGGGSDAGPVTEAPTEAVTKAPFPTRQPLVKPTSAPGPTLVIPESTDSRDKTESKPVEVTMDFYEDGTYSFNRRNTFYVTDVILTVNAPAGTSVYYTLDGSVPNDTSTLYTGPITFAAHGGSFPDASIFRARAKDADGRWSKTAARTFLAGTKLDNRFSTLVFSVSGDPADLTEGPDGIFFGENYLKRGRESERPVYIEAWNSDGSNIFEQYGGVRIYGGYNRMATIKSMKLFARKTYDEDHKNFKFSGFNTKKLDGSDDIIKKYDKLVLRNAGNDNQFAFIRDELSQRLCEKAGFECFESVLPAVTYLNGTYYGYLWLHETYCDKYFKEKFGDAEGEFIILEGGDQKKDDDDDPLAQTQVNAYNSAYDRFISMDLTDDSNFAQVTAFMDVEDYLDFFAWNICLNNWDWPNNNYKCVRYVEADPSELNREGALPTPDSKYFDGRWHYLVHDMDYTYGLYNQDKTQANYNTLRVVMSPNNDRYAPLFVKLMERSDCREYFRSKCYEYFAGPLSEESIIETYNIIHNERLEELHYYYNFFERRRRLGDDSLWTSEYNYGDNEDQIFQFAKDRPEYALRYLEELLPSLETQGEGGAATEETEAGTETGTDPETGTGTDQ